MFRSRELYDSIPDHQSTTQKFWLNRMILQTLWRWRHVQGPSRVHNFLEMKPVLRSFTADNDPILAIIKTNFFLVIAISLGLGIDDRDLYDLNDEYVIFPFLSLHLLIQWQQCAGYGSLPFPLTTSNIYREGKGRLPYPNLGPLHIGPPRPLLNHKRRRIVHFVDRGNSPDTQRTSAIGWPV